MNEQRQEYLIRCLNAAANLYGLLSYEEFIGLYNRYAADKEAPVSDPLTVAEIDEMMKLPDPDDFDVLSEEMWFAGTEVDGEKYIVSRSGFCSDPDSGREDVDEHGVAVQLEQFEVDELRVLSEEDFLVYEEPMAFEETGVTKKFAKYLRSQHGFGKDDCWMSVWNVQNELRIRPSTRIAMFSVRNTLGIEIVDDCEFDDLLEAVTPLVRNTRAWDYRGYTETELVNDGRLDSFQPDDSEAVRQLFLADGDCCDDDAGEGSEDSYDDYEEDAFDTGHLSDDELASMLPPAEYPKGPVDFSFVKDKAKREEVLEKYRLVRDVTVNFVREVVVEQFSDKARKAAMKRLGFPATGGFDRLSANYDMVAGDFGTMLDDQFGEPLISRILAHPEKLSKYHQLGAAYYANYRYAWLVVEAVKAGVGLKCRNLMNGEELFLMEESRSRDADVKGSTICVGIAPMGDVYFCIGVQHPANFEPSEAVHRMVRQKLGLPLEGALELSAVDQARFAEETIRRIDALGRFATIAYGGI